MMKRTEIINDLRAFATQFNPFSEESGLIMSAIAELEKTIPVRKILLPMYREFELDEYNRGYNDCLAEVISALERYIAEVKNADGGDAE
jgi:hypothetical protein